MLHEFLAVMGKYYGLDWACLCSGLAGTYFITLQRQYGFLLCAFASICGFATACLCMQVGSIIYNALFFSLMMKGFVRAKSHILAPSVIPDKI